MYYSDGSDNSNRRLSVSFIMALTMHMALLLLMHLSAKLDREKEKIITNVELLQIEPAKVQVAAAPAPEEKSIWARLKDTLPGGGGGGGGKEAAPEKPVDTMRRIVEQATWKEPDKLVDRKEPLPRPNQSELDDLKKLRDEKLNDLMQETGGQMHKVQQMMAQEQTLTDRSEPIARRSMGIDQTISIEEVGVKRAGNIADVVKEEAKQRRAEGVEDMGVSQLVEKKQSLKRRLAALGAAPSGLQDRGGNVRSSQITDVVGSIKERQKVQEVLALQKIIDEKEPRKGPPGGGGAGGGGGYGGGFGGGYGSGRGGGISGLEAGKGGGISLSEPKDLPAARPEKQRPPAPDVMAKAVKAKEDVVEVKKSPVEISGPLEKRKVLSAYVPPYPDWAKRKGIEADVSLRFFVNPAGLVTQDIFVVRTSGYSELDNLCITSLRKWAFAPLDPGEPQKDQWGIITIRFRLE